MSDNLPQLSSTSDLVSRAGQALQELFLQCHASMRDKTDALERVGQSTLDFVKSIRGGDYDARIAAATTEAVEAASDLADAIDKLSDLLRESKVQRRHPGTKNTGALDALLDQASTIHKQLAVYSLYYQRMVPGVVDRVADLAHDSSESTPADQIFTEVNAGPTDEPADLPF